MDNRIEKEKSSRMNIIVQKYGGTSVGNTDKILKVAKRIVKAKDEGKSVVVVVSAMGKTTDNLISLAQSITENPSDKELALLLVTGEQQSVALLSMALKALQCDSISLTGSQAGIKTKGPYTKSEIVAINENKIIKYLTENKVVVVAGFQGENEEGEITTLGRGGSDTTAVALAATLGCPCEIYTDVTGVYTVDPQIYPASKKINKISYQEIMEMADLGAKVLDKRAVNLGFKFNVPIYIAHSEKPEEGTYILNETWEEDNIMEEYKITGLIVDDKLLSININSRLNPQEDIVKILEVLEKHNIEVSGVHNTYLDECNNLSFICSSDEIQSLSSFKKDIVKEIKGIAKITEIKATRISVLGKGKKGQTQTIGKIIKVLKDSGIKYDSFNTWGTGLSYIVNTENKLDIIKRLAEEFHL